MRERIAAAIVKTVASTTKTGRSFGNNAIACVTVLDVSAALVRLLDEGQPLSAAGVARRLREGQPAERGLLVEEGG